MLSLSQRHSLLQRLSPQQVQYLKMLQLPVLALEQRIKEELEANPLLDDMQDEIPDQEIDAEPITAESRTESGDAGGEDSPEAERGADEPEVDRELEWSEYMPDEGEGYKAPSFTGQESEEQDEFPQRAEESLAEQLLAQLRLQEITDDETALAEEIIGNIDDHGYLLRDLSDIVDDLNKFIAATRRAAQELAESASTTALGDGHFDSYEDLIADEPFGRDRLLYSHPYGTDGHGRNGHGGFARDADEYGDGSYEVDAEGNAVHAAGKPVDPFGGDLYDTLENVPTLGGMRPRTQSSMEQPGTPPFGTGTDVDAAQEGTPRTEAASLSSLSLADMSRLSIEDLSRLLEQGTAALAPEIPPAAEHAGAAGAGREAVHGAGGHTADAGTDPAPAIEEVFTYSEAEKVLRMIQRLDPPGIGARDLRECLMIQLEVAANGSAGHDLAYRVLRDTYAEFTMKHFEKITAKLGCTTEELRDAMEVIRTLNPKPGGGSVNIVENNYVTPDFVVERDEDDFLIIPNDRAIPPLRINHAYQELIRRGEGGQRQVDRETRRFIRDKLEAAKWFIASIHQRRQTMMRVMRAIVDLQSGFFTGGPNLIRPMIYKDVAERIGMDISTVCRVVNGKYVQTDFGTFELRYFFSEKLETASGEEVSTKIVKARIQELIDAEDKHHPLSDDALTQEMERAGFHVARRTVAKYREQLNIPVARLRRAL
ncbi:MAG TPA: RNA polymerase factor sigma-54 [Candidatus Kapabacteria bacterium]|nr:RNA polymerase factor sigma-54 [Candidatus Kapabacteria bacterium]